MEKIINKNTADKKKQMGNDSNAKASKVIKKDNGHKSNQETHKTTNKFAKTKTGNNKPGNNKPQQSTKKIIKEQPEIIDWFYMSPDNINSKMIAEYLKERKLAEVELWEEMNILQIVLKDNKCIDFEPLNQPFKEEDDVAFIKENNITTIFAVTIEEGTFPQLKPIMAALLEEWGGLLCADSYNFKPKLDLKELKGNNL